MDLTQDQKGISYKSYRPIVNLVLFSFVIFLTASAQEIRTVDGVRMVHNPKGGKWGENPPFTIRLLRTIGDINTTDENLAFHMPSDIAVDNVGNIFILDSGNNRIQNFSPEGEYIATIGRRGQGPGEFISPLSLDIDARGYMYISDSGNRRIQILTPEGREYKTIRPIRHSLSKVYILNSGLLVMKGTADYRISSENEKQLPKLIRLLDSEGNIKMEFGEIFNYKNRLLNWKGNLFDFVVDQNDNIYLTFIHQNRIEKYSPEGKLLWEANRVLNYSTKPLDKGKTEITATSQSFQAPRMNKCSEGIAVDDKGRVWVVTLNRQIKKEEEVYTRVRGTLSHGSTIQVVGNTDLQETDMNTLEIFDAGGVLLGEIPLGHFVDDIYIERDFLYLLDKMRGVRYFQYQIMEKE